MADKRIDELPVAEELDNEALLAVRQNGETRSIKGELIAKFAREAAEGYATQAAESAEQAAASQDAAAQSATAAEKSKEAAEVAAQNAANEVKETLAGYVSDAEAARDAAAGSATKAGEEAGKAEVAAKNAADDVRAELQDISDAAAASRDAAAQSEKNAGASAAKAEEQATKAETAAKNAADDVRAELQDISDATAASRDAAAQSATKAEEEAGKAEAAAGKAAEDVRDELQSLVDDATASKTAAGESAAAAKESEDAAAGYLAAAEKAKGAAQTAQAGAEDAATQAEAAAGKAADDVRAELQDISDTTKGYKDAAASSATAAAGSSLAAEKSAETAKQYSGNPPMPDTDKNLWTVWDAATGDYKDTYAPVWSLLQFSYPSIEEMQADFENRQFGSLAIIASDVEKEDNARLYIRDKTAWKYLGDLSGVTGNGIKTWTKTSGDGSPGTTDTYTVTFTDGRTFVYTVYNGRDGEGAGDMLSTMYDPTGKRQDVFGYTDKAVAGAKSELETALGKKADLVDGKVDPEQLPEMNFDPAGSAAAVQKAVEQKLTDGLATKVSTDTYNTGMAGKQDKLTFDAVPVKSSENPVRSGGVYDAIEATKAVEFDVQLTASGWAGKRQSVSNPLFEMDGFNYLIAPAPSDLVAYNDASVHAEDMTAAGSMVFVCDETPTDDLTVRIMKVVSKEE